MQQASVGYYFYPKPHTMAQLSLLAIGLVFLFSLNSAISWGNLDDRFEINNNIPNLDGSNNIRIWEEKYVTQTADRMNAIIENNNNLFGGVQVDPAYSSPNSEFPNSSTGFTIMYKLGERIDGDRLVSSGSQNQQWILPQNISQTLIYPRNGVGAVVSYVEIVVEQSSNLGNGFVSSGGIGQRQISVIIEAQKTLYFRQSIQIYGY